jgi:hypothetical protein
MVERLIKFDHIWMITSTEGSENDSSGPRTGVEAETEVRTECSQPLVGTAAIQTNDMGQNMKLTKHV